MTDREYVESVWESDMQIPLDSETVLVLDDPYWKNGHVDDDIDRAHWSAAAAFTRARMDARMEEIRQVREELEVIRGQLVPASTWDIWQRITARERAALAALCEGVKPEALNDR